MFTPDVPSFSILEKDPSLRTRYKHKKVKEKTEKKMEKMFRPEKLDKEALEYKGKLREPEFVSHHFLLTKVKTIWLGLLLRMSRG